MSEFDDSLLGREVMDLEDTARWRGEKADQWPDDQRNAQAQAYLTELASKLRGVAGTPKAVAFEALHDFIFSGTDAENPVEVVRLWSEYRSGIGFRNFPATAEEYLDQLMELARDAF
jgi:hypothetical protein